MTSGAYWGWWFLGLRADLSSGLQHEPYLRRCWRGLLYFTIWVGIQDKANVWNSDNRPIFKLLYNCREVNFTSWLWSIHTQTSFCHHDLTLLWSALVLEMNLTPVLKTKRHSHSHPVFICLSSCHSTCSGSASMQVSHGFLGICGMERIRRAMPVRKSRTKAVQAQAKDQA